MGHPQGEGKSSQSLALVLWVGWGWDSPFLASTSLTGTLAGHLHHPQAQTDPCPCPNPSLFLSHFALAEKHSSCEAHRAPGKVMLEEGGAEAGSSGSKHLGFFWEQKFLELWGGEPTVEGSTQRDGASSLLHQGSTKSLNHSKQRSTLPR